MAGKGFSYKLHPESNSTLFLQQKQVSLKSVDDHACKLVGLDLTIDGILSSLIQILWN